MFGNNMMVQLGATVNLVDAEKVLQGFTKKPYTVTTRIKVDGQEAEKEISTWVDKFGKQMQRITITNAFGENIKDTVKPIKELTSAYEPLTKKVTKFKDELGNTTTFIKETNKYGETITTSIREQTSGVGRLTKTTEVYNETLGQQISKLTEVTRDEQAMAKAEAKAEEEARKLAKSQQQATESTKSLGQSFSDMIVKLSKYYLASVPIRLVRDAFQDSIQVVKEFDDALTEFKKVSDLSGESLSKYTKQLGELGEEIGKTTTELITASTEFKKSGFTDEDSAKLGRVAL